MWSKRRTQLQICGRDSGETRLGAGGGLVGAEAVSVIFCAVSAEEAEFPFHGKNANPPPQEANAKTRIIPKRRKNFRFIFLFPLQYST
jgi:hypothetical protein